MSAAGAVALWVAAVAALVGLSWWLPRPHDGIGHAAVRNRALLVVAGALVAIVAGALLMPR
ncbi:hypothetical protein [Cellulomonas carbonis]|uniref:Uncharacterized protein n=1 Tax=Cellulomonas carbonis T26 TaxID=947969 RepID=A0A0A0BRG3_9CELL|nr:hypothetical protein [Cellulomonas carbonis]KGM10561.1 hypothetical protein N868_13425 [Cellulomonas carbonis T26]